MPRREAVGKPHRSDVKNKKNAVGREACENCASACVVAQSWAIYQFCSHFMRNIGQRSKIFTVLLLEDIGSSYNVLHENTLLEDRVQCSSDGVCSVEVELNSDQFTAIGPNPL